MSLKKTFAKTILATSLAGLLTACGSSDDNESIVIDDIAVVEDTTTVEATPLYLVKTTDFTTTPWSSLLYLKESLDADTTYDVEDAVVSSGYNFVSVSEGIESDDSSFYLAIDNTAVLQRYVVSDENEIVLDGELDLTEQGITDIRNSMRSGKIYSPEKGYMIDYNTLQVIIFNPTEMTLTSVIDISDAIDVDGELYPNRWSVFPVIDGERVVVPMTFSDASYASAPFTKLVIVDTATDTVTVDTNNLCGGVSASSLDAEGNVYWATSWYVAGAHVVSPTTAQAPCIVRMKSGADAWDDSYYVDMTKLTEDGRPVYGIATADGYKAYTLVYSADEEPLTADTFYTVGKTAVWEYNTFNLDAPFSGATKVENVVAATSKINTGTFKNDAGDLVPYVDIVNSDFDGSTVYDTTDSDNWEILTTSPGDLENIVKIR